MHDPLASIMIKTGRKNMVYGALWFFGGLALTVASFASATNPGAAYYVFYGAIGVGALQFIRGASQVAQFSEHQDAQGSPERVPQRQLPMWAKVAGTICILLHLVAIITLSIAAQSGPWWLGSLGMPSQAEEPEFARGMHNFLGDVYYRPLHLTNNYHFVSNMPERSTVRFEVNVLDANGQSIKKVMFPDPNANFWVRHRQSILAMSLGDDRPVQLPDSVRVPSPPRIVWFPPRDEQKLVKDMQESELQAKRNEFRNNSMGFMAPSPWSEVLAASYARHVARVHGGAKAEITRMSRDPINPAIVLPVAPPKNFFDRSFKTLVSNFGEYSRDE